VAELRPAEESGSQPGIGGTRKSSFLPSIPNVIENIEREAEISPHGTQWEPRRTQENATKRSIAANGKPQDAAPGMK